MSSEIDVPRAARLVRDFVNTHELQIDREDLRSPETLRDWFAEQDLLPADAELEAGRPDHCGDRSRGPTRRAAVPRRSHRRPRGAGRAG